MKTIRTKRNEKDGRFLGPCNGNYSAMKDVDNLLNVIADQTQEEI